MNELPATIKAEVKFTTKNSFTVEDREWNEALKSENESGVGLLAALFFNPEKQNQDGRWLILDVDKHHSFKTAGRDVHITEDGARRGNNAKGSLSDLKNHIHGYWPRVLNAFSKEAENGYEELSTVLKEHHDAGTLAGYLKKEEPPEYDHKNRIQKIIDAQGEKKAGLLFQVFFGYLVALAGYRSVTINAVGVPDVLLADLGVVKEGSKADSVDLGALTPQDAARLIDYCRRCGDEGLAKLLEEEKGS